MRRLIRTPDEHSQALDVACHETDATSRSERLRSEGDHDLFIPIPQSGLREKLT